VSAVPKSVGAGAEEAHGRGRTGEDRFAALPTEDRALLLQVGEMLWSIRYGTVVIVVQDATVIQIETSEKIRLR
jgi:hypothetical protein